MRQDRSTLPMIPAIGVPDDPDSWLYMDALHLIKEGLLDPSLMGQSRDGPHAGSPQGAWERVIEVMRSAGQVGVYRNWLQTNGVVHECPAWCKSSHPTAAIYDPMGTEPIHEAVVGRLAGGAAQVSIEASTGAPAEIHVEVGERDLNAVQARKLAALLLDAAEIPDE